MANIDFKINPTLFVSGQLQDNNLDALVVPVQEGEDFALPLQLSDVISVTQLHKLSKLYGFKGKEGSAQLLPITLTDKICSLVLTGLDVSSDSDLTAEDAQNSGSRAAANLPEGVKRVALVLPEQMDKQTARQFALGFALRLYKFTQFKTQETDHTVPTVILTGQLACADIAADLKAVVEGVWLARDLVNMPPNHLYPRSFAHRCCDLQELGVQVRILGEEAMREKGMESLLAVGHGSIRESQLVVMEWHGQGAENSDKPLAFVGKGVTFDSGGISLKPGAKMADMIMDMGGAAAVTGLMRLLAQRKAPIYAVGVIGLVENMPDGKAQRPGDIVKTMAGKTVEILNTDAEGRMVLADALWYCQDYFNPEIIIDMATLTGAVIVSLGHEFTGLFSNCQQLTKDLQMASDQSADKVWPLPITKSFSKSLKSKYADLSNIPSSPVGGGSSTAACFLQEFIKPNVRWAHLDIAGTAFDRKECRSSAYGGTGAPVLLLDQFVRNMQG